MRIFHPLGSPFLAFLLAIITSIHAQEPIITEFLADPAEDSFQDEDCSTEDWIELHNPTGESLDISGYFLSDDPELAQ